MIAQLYKYTYHCIVCTLYIGNCVVYELYLNKVAIKKKEPSSFENMALCNGET